MRAYKKDFCPREAYREYVPSRTFFVLCGFRPDGENDARDVLARGRDFQALEWYSLDNLHRVTITETEVTSLCLRKKTDITVLQIWPGKRDARAAYQYVQDRLLPMMIIQPALACVHRADWKPVRDIAEHLFFPTGAVYAHIDGLTRQEMQDAILALGEYQDDYFADGILRPRGLTRSMGSDYLLDRARRVDRLGQSEIELLFVDCSRPEGKYAKRSVKGQRRLEQKVLASTRRENHSVVVSGQDLGVIKRCTRVVREDGKTDVTGWGAESGLKLELSIRPR